jgi:nicotinamidase-related amidase
MIPRVTAADSLLLVVDVQDKLLAKMPGRNDLLRDVAFLIDVAKLLSIPIFATEQYPKGLGPTAPEIASRLEGERLPKTAFSCCGAESFLAELGHRHRHNIVLVGMETHVCIAQTAFDLTAAGFHVFVPVDAVASRGMLDHKIALKRMDRSQCTLTTSEAIAFEWLRDAAHPQFKAVSKLVVDRAEKR